MKELGERFLTQYVPTRCKPSTQAEYQRSVELILDPFFAKAARSLCDDGRRRRIARSFSRIPYQANRILSKMMNLAETWG
ncbi:hypothetical protein TM239_01330 [Bradyrhizobium sp. TM239]|nr:hypothetical protein TM239_01330 [Bradyrhizobium sp. TM239]